MPCAADHECAFPLDSAAHKCSRCKKDVHGLCSRKVPGSIDTSGYDDWLLFCSVECSGTTVGSEKVFSPTLNVEKNFVPCEVPGAAIAMYRRAIAARPDRVLRHECAIAGVSSCPGRSDLQNASALFSAAAVDVVLRAQDAVLLAQAAVGPDTTLHLLAQSSHIAQGGVTLLVSPYTGVLEAAGVENASTGEGACAADSELSPRKRRRLMLQREGSQRARLMLDLGLRHAENLSSVPDVHEKVVGKVSSRRKTLGSRSREEFATGVLGPYSSAKNSESTPALQGAARGNANSQSAGLSAVRFSFRPELVPPVSWYKNSPLSVTVGAVSDYTLAAADVQPALWSLSFETLSAIWKEMLVAVRSACARLAKCEDWDGQVKFVYFCSPWLPQRIVLHTKTANEKAGCETLQVGKLLNPGRKAAGKDGDTSGGDELRRYTLRSPSLLGTPGSDASVRCLIALITMYANREEGFKVALSNSLGSILGSAQREN